MDLLRVFGFVLVITFSLLIGATAKTKHYIVYVGHHSHPNLEAVTDANHNLLSSVVGSLDESKAVTVHHYSKSFQGFSAKLTPDQAKHLKEHNTVVSVFESKMRKLHTTHSWDFLAIDSVHQYNQLPMDSKSDVIVGVVDGGVWPESKSFCDQGLGPVPKRFKGECVSGQNFTVDNCNRKIIGARFYWKGFEAENGPLESSGERFFRSARDSDGHGTHTASTIAGSVVGNASLWGLGRGSARGGAPSARLAIYKACWFNLCSDADILAALDDAIHDGVDVLSLSLGPDPPQPNYFEDSISIGTFHAFRKGIFVSASAGNSFFPSTASNVAPWILTVAASTLDRRFPTNVYLGNSRVLMGSSINPLKMDGYYGLIDATSAAAKGIPSANASFCKNNTLDRRFTEGKIVVCTLEAISDNRRDKSIFVREAGGVGMILVDPFINDVGFQFVIPAALIGQEDAKELHKYINTTKNPVARISLTKTVLPTKPAPQVASFSSAGPNIITPDIIKPDITGPGVNILAAWSPVATGTTAGERSLDYNIISGTSMSCPHASALAAILKSYRPSWSPAAIKSAIMTTAFVVDNTKRLIGRDTNGAVGTPFDFGSGHINPVRAVDPGLVYDFDSDDVIEFLCSSGATPLQLKNLSGAGDSVCKKPYKASYDLNYPSIAVSNLNRSVSVSRSVTYYGTGLALYVPSLHLPAGVHIAVHPEKLEFEKSGEKKRFSLKITPLKSSNGGFVFGSLTWSDGYHMVRSPIALNVV